MFLTGEHPRGLVSALLSISLCEGIRRLEIGAGFDPQTATARLPSAAAHRVFVLPHLEWLKIHNSSDEGH